jgi:hypothetical protein
MMQANQRHAIISRHNEQSEQYARGDRAVRNRPWPIMSTCATTLSL